MVRKMAMMRVLQDKYLMTDVFNKIDGRTNTERMQRMKHSLLMMEMDDDCAKYWCNGCKMFKPSVCQYWNEPYVGPGDDEDDVHFEHMIQCLIGLTEEERELYHRKDVEINRRGECEKCRNLEA